MITFNISLDIQSKIYDFVKEKLKTGFYHKHKFYVLPFMPEKFRDRVVHLPTEFEPETIFKKHRQQLEILKMLWGKSESEFIQKLIKYFPKLNNIDIEINPSLYGTIGSYWIQENKIILLPRYDRSLKAIQKLLINALVHYFFYPDFKNLDRKTAAWFEKQKRAKEIQLKLIKGKKGKSMIDILNTNFAGQLAYESAQYLNSLGYPVEKDLILPTKLTPYENKIYSLLTENKNKLVTYDLIADTLWQDKTDEKFSEYAITKLVERLRKKMPANSIHSQRGIGYIYY